MNNDTDLSIVIKARNEAQGVFDQVKSQASDLGGKLKDGFDAAVPASKALLAGVAALGAGVVAFGVVSVKAYEDSQNVQAQLAAAIKSTGGAAGQTIDALNAQSHALQEQTKYSDEAVGSAQAMLLTFTGISGKTFPEATKTTLDMAQALGMDATDAAMQLGKALNDPATGMTKLMRVGVTFNDQQQTQIKSMQEAGDVAGAQAIILKELQKEFGGSAEAAGTTFAGQVEKLKNNFNDLQETVGKTIITALLPLVTAFSNWVNRVSDAGGMLQYFQGLFEQHRQLIIIVAGAILAGLVPAVYSLVAGFVAMAAPLIPFLVVGALLAVLVEKMVDKFGGWRKVMQDIKPYIEDIKTALDVLWTGLSGGDATMTGAGRQWDKFGNTVMGVHDFLVNLAHDIGATLLVVWHLLGDAIQGLLPSLEALWSTIATRLWPAIEHLWQALNPALIDALKILAVVIGVAVYAAIWLAINVLNILISTFSWLAQIVSNVAGFIGSAIMGIVHFIQTAIATIVTDWQQWQANVQAIAAAVGAFFSAVWQGIVDAFQAIVGAIGTIIGVYVGIWQAIISGFVGVVSWVFNAAVSVAQAVWHGITSFISNEIDGWRNIINRVGGFFSDVASSISGPFKTIFNAIAHMWNDSIGKLHFTAPSWVPGLGGKGFSMPELPYLAQGGIVTGPTTAVIGEGTEPEAVIPLSKIASVAASMNGNGGGSNQAPITINLTVGNVIGNPDAMRQLSITLQKALIQAMQGQGTTDVNQLRAT